MKEIIWVYDDEEKFSSTWVGQLKKNECVTKKFDPKVMDKDHFDETIRVLSQRQQLSNENKIFTFGELDIDHAGMFFIDYDLFDPDKKSYITGEKVAYLTRCFSSCGLIIGVNQHLKKLGTYYFDLKMEGHLSSYCDLNIGEGHLDVNGLWDEQYTEFRPWNWPNLPHYLDLFREKINNSHKYLDQSITNVLGFDKLIEFVPLSVREFLGDDPTKITFRQFTLESGNGIIGREKALPEQSIANISIARISKWLEQFVLPGQNILVDAPHLVSRYPSLLLEDPTKIETWNKTTELNRTNLGLDLEQIEKYTFSDLWVSKPTWFWGELSKDPNIEEVQNPWNKKIHEFRFCEDSSKFHNKKDTIEFNIETESPYIRRHVTKPQFPGVNYQPKIRLLSAE